MPDGERVKVQTYVPSYQKGEWSDHADELDMTLSEFVRTMIQAGRRGFGSARSDGRAEPPSRRETPGVHDVETALLELLDDEEFLAWEAILDGITDDVEDLVAETLDRLQDENRVRYSGPHGGYTLANDEP